jgi:hypothetical protein
MPADTLQARRRQLREKLRALSYRPLMRGSLVESRIRCGKPGCACARDPERRHLRKYLSVHLEGRTLTLHVRPEDEPAVQQMLGAYREIWEVINGLTDCEVDDLRRAARQRRKARREGKP